MNKRELRMDRGAAAPAEMPMERISHIQVHWRYGVTVKLIEPKMPVVGSVAITWNVTDEVGPDVVVRNPVVGSILTFEIEVGFVLQVTESVTGNVPLPVVAVAVN